MTEITPRAFGLDRDPPTAVQRLLARTFGHPVERLFGLHALELKYQRARATTDGPEGFIERALAELAVDIACQPDDLARIPPAGPVVVVANHPFGGLEGLLLARLLLKRRPDVRVLANYILERIPELRDILLLVDPWARPSSRNRNARALKEALRHLRAGGLMAVFPSGEVAHRFFGDRGELRESPWQPSVGRIIQRSRAPIVPVYFCGENSLGFQMAGMVHPLLRTVLLPRELLNKRGRSVEVRIGDPISPSALAGLDTGAFTAHLQARTEALRNRGPAVARGRLARKNV